MLRGWVLRGFYLVIISRNSDPAMHFARSASPVLGHPESSLHPLTSLHHNHSQEQHVRVDFREAVVTTDAAMQLSPQQ